MSVVDRLNASKNAPHWRTSVAKEELDKDDARPSHMFIEDEAETSDDEEDNSDDEAGTGPVLQMQEQLIYSSGQNPYQRANQLLQLQPNEKDTRAGNIIFSNAMRTLRDLAARRPGDAALFGVSDANLSTLILDGFITLEARVSEGSSGGSGNDSDKDSYSENEEDNEEIVNELASRVYEVIENVNATRASRPQLKLSPFTLDIALAALPEDESIIADYIREVMNSLWYSDSEVDKDDKDDETADVEHIIEDRETNGVPEYLVKWEGFDDSYNAWLTLTELSDYPLLVREYYDETGEKMPADVVKLLKNYTDRHAQQRRRNRIIYSSDEDS